MIVMQGEVASNEKIKIGLIVPLSGEYSYIGKSILKSTRMALNKIDDQLRLNLSFYQTNQNNEDNKLQTLLFAGLLLEGSVVSYEANETSGGAGARYLGIGISKAYRTDTLTVQLRLISVSSGQVLICLLYTSPSPRD